MGMIENARVSLGSGDAVALARANVQATIAVAESLDGIMELLEAVLQKLDALDSAVMMIANNTD